MSDLLRSKLAGVRRKRTVVRVLTALAMVVGGIVLVTMATAMLDWLFELPLWLRAVILAAEIAGAGYAIWSIAIAPIVFGPDEEGLALAVERAWPVFRSRLISAIQLAPVAAGNVGGSVGAPGLVRALVDETEAVAKPLDFGTVVPTKPLLRLGGIATVIVLLAGGAFAYGGQSAVALVQRAVLVPGVEVPRKTRVRIQTAGMDLGDKTIARGDSIVLLAAAEGVVPRAGEVRVTSASGAVNVYPMEPTSTDPGSFFSRRIDAVPNTFTYVVRLNDGTSKSYTVRAVERPTVSALAVRQIFPAYTKLPETRKPTGDLSFLAGSRMALDVTATKPLRTAGAASEARSVVSFFGKDDAAAGPIAEYALRVDPANPTLAHAVDGEAASVPIPAGASAFRVRLVDEEGAASKDETAYRIDVVPDRPPVVAVRSPAEREALATTRGKVDITYDAGDDFALAELALMYRVVPQGDMAAQLQAAAKTGNNGLLGTYFSGREFSGASETRTDATIDFDWGEGAPMESWPTDVWSAKWSGQIVAPQTGTYVLRFECDDGIRVYVDGKPVLDKWNGGIIKEDATPVELKAGVPAELRIEYFEAGGAANLKMLWSRQGDVEPPTVVPASSLLPPGATERKQAEQLSQERSIPLPFDAASAKSVRGTYAWTMASLGGVAPEGTILEWWLAAKDGNTASGPGTAATERYTLRVVSEVEKRAELMDKLGDYLGQIDAVRDGQVDLSTKLGTIVRDATTRPAQP